MGFLDGCGAVEIGEARSTHKYMFSYVQATNRYYCVFVGKNGTGEVWESRTQGLAWHQVDDVGRVESIAIRGRYYSYTRVSRGFPRAGVSDTATGNVLAESVLDSASGKWSGGLVIPVPELSPTTVMAVIRETFGSQWYFHTIGAAAPFGRVPGDSMFAIWGSEEPGEPGVPHGSIHVIWEYVDRFYEVIRYACWAKWNLNGWVIERDPTRSNSGPFAHRFENDIHGSGYEGFLNGRHGWEGVGKQQGNPSPAFFLPADKWQGGINNSAPMWIPNLTSRQTNLKFPISSVPSGLTADGAHSRGAVMGFVGGRRTFGMIEPGYGFAHCVGDGYSATSTTTSTGFDDTTTQFIGQFSNRKFIGNLGTPFSRSVMWMPYSSGIFGMGVGLHLGGPNQKIMWVYDKEPNSIPTSVRVENGVYTERDDVQASQARRGDSAYYRW